jgi:hypothetical protein
MAALLPPGSAAKRLEGTRAAVTRRWLALGRDEGVLARTDGAFASGSVPPTPAWSASVFAIASGSSWTRSSRRVRLSASSRTSACNLCRETPCSRSKASTSSRPPCSMCRPAFARSPTQDPTEKRQYVTALTSRNADVALGLTHSPAWTTRSSHRRRAAHGRSPQNHGQDRR